MWSFIFDAYSDKSDFDKYTNQISLKCCIGYCMAVCLTEDTWYLLFFSFFLLIVLCWVIPLAGVCWLSGHQAEDQLYQRLSVCPSCLHAGQVTNNSPYTFLSGETSIFLDNTFVGKVSLGWAHWRTYLWNWIKKVQKGFPFPAQPLTLSMIFFEGKSQKGETTGTWWSFPSPGSISGILFEIFHYLVLSSVWAFRLHAQVYLQTVIPLILSLVCNYMEINLRYKQMESGEQMGVMGPTLHLSTKSN